MTWRRALLILAVYLAAMLPGIGAVRPLTLHEVFTAEPAREFLDGPPGPWLVQRMAGVNRYQKPPTMSWLIAGVMRLTGSRGEWVARAPAVAAGAILALLVAAMAARQYGPDVGLAAGLTQATCYAAIEQARLAEADMPLAACVTAALWAMSRLVTGTARPLPWVFAFHACLGAAFLFKGPVGILFAFAGTLAYAVTVRDWRVLRQLFHPLGLLLMLAIAATWAVPAILNHPELLKIAANEGAVQGIGKLTQGDDGGKAWHTYLWGAPLLLAPWVGWTVVGLVTWWRNRPRPAASALALAWFVAGFVLLNISAYKSRHYLAPIMPALGAFTGLGAVTYLRDRHARPRQPRTDTIVAAVWALAWLAGGAIAWRQVPSPAGPAIAVIAAIIALGGALAVVAESRRRLTAQVAAITLTAVLAIAGVNRYVTPVLDVYGPYADLGRRATTLIPNGSTTCLIGLGQVQITFYLPLPLTRADDAARDPLPPGEFYAVMPEATLDIVRARTDVATVTPLDRAVRRRPPGRERPGDAIVLARVTRN